jgi:hypothetical protein
MEKKSVNEKKGIYQLHDTTKRGSFVFAPVSFFSEKMIFNPMLLSNKFSIAQRKCGSVKKTITIMLYDEKN